jgi:hypothetical protein
MAEELCDLAALERHVFSRDGRQYSVVTATATRSRLDELTQRHDAPIDFHFTVTSPDRSEPISVQLHLSRENAADLEFVRAELEDAVSKIVSGRLSPNVREHL